MCPLIRKLIDIGFGRLDLACCVGHNGTVVDRLMQTLYRASETSTDVTLARIREVPRWCCEGDTSESGLRFVGGVLQQSPADLVEVLLHRAPKSALKTLRQMLIRAISTEKGSAPLDRQLKMGNVKPGDLDAILNVLRGPPGAMERNWPLFLLVSAVAESFATVRESSWDRLLSLGLFPRRPCLLGAYLTVGDDQRRLSLRRQART